MAASTYVSGLPLSNYLDYLQKIFPDITLDVSFLAQILSWESLCLAQLVHSLLAFPFWPVHSYNGLVTSRSRTKFHRV